MSDVKLIWVTYFLNLAFQKTDENWNILMLDN